MRNEEMKKYTKLNDFAKQGGIVIFGCGEDKDIPTCELCQAFAIEAQVYNRSFEEISVNEALNVYKEAIAPLAPESVLLHIGEADKLLFSENPTEFGNKYRELIEFIKEQNKNCRVAVLSLRNDDHDFQTEKMSQHLKYIADSERCEYVNIANKKVWNPKAAMETASFIHSLGFVRSLKGKRPLYDFAKIMFCYEA